MQQLCSNVEGRNVSRGRAAQDQDDQSSSIDTESSHLPWIILSLSNAKVHRAVLIQVLLEQCAERGWTLLSIPLFLRASGIFHDENVPELDELDDSGG